VGLSRSEQKRSKSRHVSENASSIVVLQSTQTDSSVPVSVPGRFIAAVLDDCLFQTRRCPKKVGHTTLKRACFQLRAGSTLPRLPSPKSRL
jgi:hypothetical protein